MPDEKEAISEYKKSMHWSEIIAETIIREKSEPYIITGGMTTSGPTHLGTICEFLFPQAISNALMYKGKKSRYIFIADILDAFDSVPTIFEKYADKLKPHLGKPLCEVPDPTGQCPSFGDYFLEDAKEIMKKLEVSPEVVRINELYENGGFDKYARLFFQEEEKVRAVVERTSVGRSLPSWWSPLMPICEKCGKIATTRITSYSEGTYSYACDKDVGYTRGCGHSGKSSIDCHRYKLTWRLHWPAWQDYFGTSIECAGVDHFTKGGSRDTLEAIFREIFKKEPPIGFKYGFILFRGKKYSKSKDTGMVVSELIKFVPPEVLKYILLKPDLQENVDIDPEPRKLLKMIEDYEHALSLLDSKSLEELSRAERKKALAAKLASSHAENERGWKTHFMDLVLYRNLQWPWEKIIQETKDERSVAKLSKFIEEWERRSLLPEEYSFSYRPSKASDGAIDFFKKLEVGMTAKDIHNLAFEVAKEKSMQANELFEKCYLALLSKDRGPKLGKLVEAIGIERVKKDVL